MNPLMKYKERRRVTWYFLEKKTGIHRSVLRNYAAGVYKMRRDTAEKISNVTGLTIKDLAPITSGRPAAADDLFTRKAEKERVLYPVSQFRRDAVKALFRVITCPRNFARVTHT